MRVISLAPTQTEIIAALGVTPAGVTVDCDFPQSASNLPKFGSWHAPDLHRVLAAKPDLVCTFGKHQEEIAKTLAETGCTVYHSDPGSVAASLESMRELAGILHRRGPGALLIDDLEARLDRVGERFKDLRPADRPEVFRIMQWKPLITIGPGAFQHDVIARAGGLNIMADGPAPYFACDARVVCSRSPDLIFFCEPHIRALLFESGEWDRVKAVRNDRVHLFACGLTCRSGPRIVDMVERLAEALHPGLEKSIGRS